MPRMRSPSQCPGTALSAISGGRWLIIMAFVMNGLAATSSSLPRKTKGASRTQTGRQLPAQRTASLNIQGLIDRLMADAHGRILGVIKPEPMRDLFGTPGYRPTPALTVNGSAPFPYHIGPTELEALGVGNACQQDAPRHRCAARRWSRACCVSDVWRRGRSATVPRLLDSQSYRHASWRCAEPPARSYWVIVQAYGQWTGSRPLGEFNRDVLSFWKSQITPDYGLG